MLTEFSSFEQTKVFNYFHSHKNGLVMELLQPICQVYTIHAQINERILPCIHSLLPNKIEGTYTRLFSDL